MAYTRSFGGLVLGISALYPLQCYSPGRSLTRDQRALRPESTSYARSDLGRESIRPEFPCVIAIMWTFLIGKLAFFLLNIEKTKSEY